MTTPRIRSLVSGLTVTLALAGCASAPSRLASVGPTATEESPLAVRFDNDARDYVHVYLAGERREWLLGRVETGARATLRIPVEALAERQGHMRLVVLEGQRVTLRAASEARATMTIAQPAAVILSQRWMFSQTQLTSLGRVRH